ncbi:hypothetical protein A3F55_02715 [Candidatus Adlerbacteria bacterium RIFCSPHIGHO2_12_FULL_53_18]|uniref:Plasmid stabilization protein n=1 Tax=Candidatus Adlerbacteria bacterium RIFCSPHIGHO2_12_FULL_53_18 TaxID=1797242 RepID=A0A1F4XUL4_9BACT|nr:MAG: hypothetical protein A3F55_02715 [Candidatus Adlerbacteria bacterium RIFCSPHIGHO2_12_FULL_53_18]
MEVFFSPLYLRQYKKTPSDIREIAKKKTKIFAQNPFDPRLRVHKLTGKMEGLSAFSVTYSYRIIFDIIEDSEEGKIARFFQIGTHDIYE